MSGIHSAALAIGVELTADLSDGLENARSRIETRFLEGGTVLLGVLDSVSKMIETLDAMMASLSGETAERTRADLADIMTRLAGLPRLEEDRQQGLTQIGEIERELGEEVSRMRETLRYLRTFALTAKITGAGVSEFAGFAEEIIERIRYGSDQVESFAAKLAGLSQQLKPAAVRGQQILASYRDLVPKIAGELERGAAQLTEHHRQLAVAAQSVRKLAGAVQTKLATVLSAMQIGDITRQRIEHCQSSLAVIDDYLESGAGRALGSDQRARLRACVLSLVYRQLDQTRVDFKRDTAKIVSTVGSFNADISAILSLRKGMNDDEGTGNSVIRQLETNIASAQDVVRTVTSAASESDELSRSTGLIVRELLDGIEIVRVVRTDIQYMALNTNLRCSRIGEEGRAINVVTSELRAFAGQMDESAESIMVRLHRLEEFAGALAGGAEASDDGDVDLYQGLAAALDDIRQAADRMEESLTAVDRQGQQAVQQMETTIRKLDFQAELGDILESCAEQIGRDAPSAIPDTSDIEGPMSEIGASIGRLYTMAAERELHAAIFGAAPAPAVSQVGAGLSVVPTSDEELFDDALF
ncbi:MULTISPECIES: methyl-accepting chemotaxis sensory transducer [Alphaproteobacteria]|uniref:Chemotaxis protein n=2 Tax=Alphaproteobacteria TaxID=28211 RepID=A0A512HJC3_9HYPH|nr:MULTISPECIES: methyl-accepting chemotaxis sensory transducer [Alphaproteobacteria]GEO85535.1 chemotaxis protein [Ciceribacter naphthalenivorans]GLR21443.1 chemotaxis protein [Ciceribacter naphthalenivorans]GLT04299.1 chemotaxis protein [Sphingomonas psychrolutea]